MLKTVDKLAAIDKIIAACHKGLISEDAMKSLVADINELPDRNGFDLENGDRIEFFTEPVENSGANYDELSVLFVTKAGDIGDICNIHVNDSEQPGFIHGYLYDNEYSEDHTKEFVLSTTAFHDALTGPEDNPNAL